MKQILSRARWYLALPLWTLSACSRAPGPGPAMKVDSIAPPAITQQTAPPLPPTRMIEAPVAASASEAARPQQPALRRVLPDDPFQLRNRYLAGTVTREERSEILHALGRIESVAAVDALGVIFEREKRLELRMEVLEALGDCTQENLQPKQLAILELATAAKQPFQVRLSAMHQLAGIESKRVAPILRRLATDSNADIGAQAEELLIGLE